MARDTLMADVGTTLWSQVNPLEQARAQLDWVQANAHRFEDGKAMIAKAQAEYTGLRDQSEEWAARWTAEIIAKVKGSIKDI